MTDVTFTRLFEGKQSRFEDKVKVSGQLLTKLEECKIITDRQGSEIEVNFVTLCTF